MPRRAGTFDIKRAGFPSRYSSIHSGNIDCLQAWCWDYKNEGRRVLEGQNNVRVGGICPGPASSTAGVSDYSPSIPGCVQLTAGPASISKTHSYTALSYSRSKFPHTCLPSTQARTTECKLCAFDKIQDGHKPVCCAETAGRLSNYSFFPMTAFGPVPWGLA